MQKASFIQLKHMLYGFDIKLQGFWPETPFNT